MCVNLPNSEDTSSGLFGQLTDSLDTQTVTTASGFVSPTISIFG